MENRFNNRDFEQFVKQNADQYRMYPSENVWKGIHNTLHTRRRWYGIGLGFLILTAGVVTWVMMASNDKNKPVTPAVADASAPAMILKAPEKKELVIAAPGHNSFITAPGSAQQKLFLSAAPPAATVTTLPASTSVPENTELPFVAKSDSPVPVETSVKIPASSEPSQAAKSTATAHINQPAVPVHQYSFATRNSISQPEPARETVPEPAPNVRSEYPLTIESVVNSYSHIRNRKRVSLQLFITPTISYRKLNENKEFTNLARNSVSSGPTSSYYNYADINNVVTHKPDIGIQLGLTAGYPLTRNLQLIGGLQFNVSKYDIKAYTHPGEIATIALQNTAGGTNTVSTVTNYRNTGGYLANWLHNLYFSASAPVGLELKLSSNRKSYIGISATAQPTYIIGNRAYLISTDYKNYAEVPSLTRKWNINAGFEAFAGNNTGKLRWRIGPQVRYQAKSSFIDKYPVKEHLFDFGLKMGIFLKK